MHARAVSSELSLQLGDPSQSSSDLMHCIPLSHFHSYREQVAAEKNTMQCYNFQYFVSKTNKWININFLFLFVKVNYLLEMIFDWKSLMEINFHLNYNFCEQVSINTIKTWVFEEITYCTVDTNNFCSQRTFCIQFIPHSSIPYICIANDDNACGMNWIESVECEQNRKCSIKMWL